MPLYQIFVKTELSLERRLVPESFTSMDEIRELLKNDLDTTLSDEELCKLAYLGMAEGEFDNGRHSASAEIKLCLVGLTDAPLV